MQPFPRFCGMAAICTFRQILGSTYRRYYKSHRRDQYGSRAASICCDISMPGVRVKHPLFVRPSAKTNAGMGGRHRSQHVLLPLFKVGSAAHNNELGNRGRGRSKTSGTYPPPRRPTTIPAEDLKDDPTVKPTAMLEDTLLDLTIVATIVVDPFLGLGSTRVAADNPAACAVASSWTSSMTM
jgi:hypothetical protein